MTATWASLRRFYLLGKHFHKHATTFGQFVLNHTSQHSPSRIEHRAIESSLLTFAFTALLGFAGHPFDIQLFRCNEAMTANDLCCNFVRPILPLIC